LRQILSMKKFHIELTAEESTLLSKIDLRDDFPPGIDAHQVYQSNRQPILTLLASLDGRDAIPAHRIRYFTDADYKPGRTKGSRLQLFEKDNEGDEIYEHPNFKKHLRYFLFGPDLPDAAISEFETDAPNPQWVSGSDGIDLAKKAIAISRKHGLQKRRAADEFFKLALDLGISFSQADQIQGIIRRSGLK
jgi:hypothetical protein